MLSARSRCFAPVVSRCMATMPPCDYTPPKYDGPSKEELLKIRKQHMNSGLFLYYSKPIVAHAGYKQWIFDETGRRYLDFFGGICTVGVGHNHPKVSEAAKKQIDRINHSTTIYLNNEVVQYCQELAAKLPSHLNNIYLVNSGSEATDLASMMARLHTGNWDVIGLRNGYHGMSMGAMGLTNLSSWKFPTPSGFGIKCAMNPDTYRGNYRSDDPDAGSKYARDVADIIKFETCGKVAGFIAETIQGVGGLVCLPDGYLAKVYEHVHNAGGLCIADEVQGGFGRTGSHYWSFQHHGVKPDIVTMAKSIGNGYALAAVATSDAIASTIAKKLHFNTYGGNPLSAAVGRAVLKVIDEEGIQNNCQVVGEQLRKGLLALQKKHSIIGDVRGRGLMIGVELVKDKKELTPATAETAQAFETCKDLGLLIGKGGLYGNVFRLQPPMCVTKADADFVLQVLDEALTKL